MRLNPALFLLLLMPWLGAGAAEPADPAASIKAGNDEWVQAMERGDAKLMAHSYAADAVFCTRDGQCIQGHDAIEAFMQARLQKSGKAKQAAVDSRHHERDGDFVYEWGYAAVVAPDGKTGGGRYLTVWKPQADGSWKICRNIVLP